MDVTVFLGMVMAWRLAGSPTLRSPFPPSKKATLVGVVLRPSLFGITTGSFPSITATQELVVPRSIPIIFPMICCIYRFRFLKPGKPYQWVCQQVFTTKRVTQWQNFNGSE